VNSDRVKQALTKAAGRYTVGQLFNGSGTSCANLAVCAQGALWAFMTKGKWGMLDDDQSALEDRALQKVCDFYDLKPESVNVIPTFNDSHENDDTRDINIPADVYAWLEFYHKNPRMIEARKIIRWMQAHKHHLGAAANRFFGEVRERVAAINEVLVSALTQANPDLAEDTAVTPCAAWELIEAAVTGEKKPKLPIFKMLVKEGGVPKRMLTCFLAAPSGPGWDKGRRCVLKELKPDLEKTIANEKRRRSHS